MTNIGFKDEEITYDQHIFDELDANILWEIIFDGVINRRERIAKEHGIIFEIRPKEDGHNTPHCHASYQGQNISISLTKIKVIAGNIDKMKVKFALKWVEINIDILKKYWNSYHIFKV